MKKIIAFLSLFSLFLLSAPIRVSAGASIDQEYYKATDGSLAVKSNVVILQSFRPMTYSTMDKIDVNLRNASGTVGFVLKKWNGEDWDPIRYINGQPAVNGWNTFDFEDVAVVVGARYCITLEASSYDTQWYYGQLAPNGPYPNGFAQYGGNYTDYPEKDFHFRTWGTDPVEIVEEQTNPGSDQDPEQTGAIATAGTGAAPATTTSFSIVKPTGLVATYSEGAKLAWKASTTADIDGYLVFRSETKGKDYTKIGQTIKTALEYTDNTVVASTTYYYMVRAFKGTDQSANSSEASLAIPATAGPSRPTGLKVDSKGVDFIAVSWTKNPETNISKYLLKIYKGEELVNSAEVEVSKTNYYFDNLSADTEYRITLVAKDTADKESAVTEIIQRTPSSLVSDGFMTKTLILCNLVGAGLILILVLFLLAYHRKHFKKAKKESLKDL